MLLSFSLQQPTRDPHDEAMSAIFQTPLSKKELKTIRVGLVKVDDHNFTAKDVLTKVKATLVNDGYFPFLLETEDFNCAHTIRFTR